MQVVKGEIVAFDAAITERLVQASNYEWPHAFVRMAVDPDEMLSRFGANHIHAVPGDHLRALRAFCHLADVDYDGLGTAA
jgi:L-fucose isomerase